MCRVQRRLYLFFIAACHPSFHANRSYLLFCLVLCFKFNLSLWLLLIWSTWPWVINGKFWTLKLVFFLFSQQQISEFFFECGMTNISGNSAFYGDHLHWGFISTGCSGRSVNGTNFSVFLNSRVVETRWYEWKMADTSEMTWTVSF